MGQLLKKQEESKEEIYRGNGMHKLIVILISLIFWAAHVWTRTDSAVGLEDLPTCRVLPLVFLHLDKTKQNKKMLFMDGPMLLGSHSTSIDDNHLIMTVTVGADCFSSSWYTRWVTAMLDSPEPLNYFIVCVC